MSMYFVQHGLALDKSVDSKRPLSEEGMQAVTKVAKHLSTFEFNINQVFHSGKKRAEQTADIFAFSLNLSSALVHPHLNPNDDVGLIVPILKDNALYVGHLPHMDKLVSYLLGGQSGAGIVKFENSAVVCLDKVQDDFQLQWVIKPSII